jgi:single-strand DNA-binding protein
MSNDLNMCQFIGRLVDTPELRQAGQTAICNFTLANGWKTKEKEGTEYIRCVAYSRLAEVIAEYMVKGQQMYVSGRQTTRKYDDNKGVTRYSTEVIADRMQMLAKPQGHQAEAKPVQVAKVSKPIEAMDDDIPF